jgi:hypothetical protein
MIGALGGGIEIGIDGGGTVTGTAMTMIRQEW